MASGSGCSEAVAGQASLRSAAVAGANLAEEGNEASGVGRNGGHAEPERTTRILIRHREDRSKEFEINQSSAGLIPTPKNRESTLLSNFWAKETNNWIYGLVKSRCKFIS